VPRLSRILAPTLFALSLQTASAESFKDAYPDIYSQLGAEEQKQVGALELQHGTIKIDGGKAEVALPDNFYALNAKDAQYVLEKLWGNPPDSSTLGMIFAKGATPYDADVWAATIAYDPMGYVSDEDADSYDYDQMLIDMQKDAADRNPERAKQGYGSVEIKGWAATPHYDKAARKLYWAKRLKFSDYSGDTLNYDIRILGRKGVLIVGFIAGIDQLPQVEAAAPEVLKIVNFTEGNRYADFVPGVDTVAAVGIGGLIAGQVAAKTGLLALALVFLKKGFVLVLIFGAALLNKVKSFFTGKTTTTPLPDPQQDAPLPQDPKDDSLS
jgi:uncharacterized membrane-anchored protein